MDPRPLYFTAYTGLINTNLNSDLHSSEDIQISRENVDQALQACQDTDTISQFAQVPVHIVHLFLGDWEVQPRRGGWHIHFTLSFWHEFHMDCSGFVSQFIAFIGEICRPIRVFAALRLADTREVNYLFKKYNQASYVQHLPEDVRLRKRLRNAQALSRAF